MKHVSIQSQAELLENLNLYESAHTKGREPDKDYIYENNLHRIRAELNSRELKGETKA